MTRIDRRRFLQLSGAGALAGAVAAGRAPAFAQGTTLHWLKPVEFVPASDVLLRGKIAAECEKALGFKFVVETIDGNGIQARITSAIQSATGPDIIMAVNNWAQLYAGSVADVSAVAEAIGKAQGGYYETSRAIAYDGKKWIAVPWQIIGTLLTNRKSWWREIGYGPENFPKTWEEYRAAGKKLKAAERPFGQTLGHTFGDAPAFWYPYLWSWGGKEVEADGKTVAINSKETIESITFAVGAWKDCYDPGGLAWDDASNNRAFLSNTCSSTNNGASIYLLAKSKPESYLTEKGTPLKDDIFHAPLPKGAAGQFSYHVPFANMVMGYSKNQKAAKELLAWLGSEPVYREWFTSQQGFAVGPTTIWENDPLWHKDPVMLPFRTSARSGRFAGYAGPSGRPAAEAVSKYIVTDMYAKAVQGMSAADAAKGAQSELAKIYS
ncbi:MAG TPA: extracellular solute-binding protein [Stellaceae bacterium]|nr:extracellular solute-binding protein [Stellaceae bacterium]